MTKQLELKSLPPSISGLSRYRINVLGEVFRIEPLNVAMRKKMKALTQYKCQQQWQGHGERNSPIVLLKQDDLNHSLTVACFHPHTHQQSPLRTVQLAPKSFRPFKTVPSPESTKSLYFPQAGDLSSGWYRLEGDSEVATELDGTAQMLNPAGWWHFHGPSIAAQIFGSSNQ
jgi:hypothetical protein